MESNKVKELRSEVGIKDIRNTHTEEQQPTSDNRTLCYIDLEDELGDDPTKHPIQYREVPGYISKGESACIFIKDKAITGRDDCYMPVIRIHLCREVEEGIYHDRIGDKFYCVPDSLLDAQDYAIGYMRSRLKERKREIEQEIALLKRQL